MIETEGSMLPQLGRRERTQLARTWDGFMAGNENGLECLRPEIRTSWEYSRRLGIDPNTEKLPQVSEKDAVRILPQYEELTTLASSYFQTLLKAWATERFIVGISDRHGVILYLTGDPKTIDQATEMNMEIGASMAEDLIGTAITGLVLSYDRPSYIVWAEHYCQMLHNWVAIGAPIHHPLSRQLVAVVGAAQEAMTHPYAFELIEHVAKYFEESLHHKELAHRTSLLNEYHRFLLHHPNDPVLALDRWGHVWGVSPSTRQLLDSPQQLLGRSFDSLPQVEGSGIFPQPQKLQPHEIQVNVKKHQTSICATVLPVEGQRQPVGSLLVLSPPPTPRRRRPQEHRSWAASHTFDDLIGQSIPFQEALTFARETAAHEFPVLLIGESGTGKDIFSQAIHLASGRGNGPFVPINCGATSDELLAAELFGYAERAFTGAVRGGHRGKIELAHRGTLFLDEIEDMPAKMQVSLLRVLEEERVIRVGTDRSVTVDVRVIAASQGGLEAAVSEGRFRLDLYHRLAVFPIHLPPLRERKSDIHQLSTFLLERLGFPHVRLSPQALHRLQRYSWPGNVRELRNVLLRTAHVIAEHTILPSDLSLGLGAEIPLVLESGGSLHQAEQDLIRRALAKTSGNVAQAAIQLGIHRVTLYRKMRKYGLFDRD